MLVHPSGPNGSLWQSSGTTPHLTLPWAHLPSRLYMGMRHGTLALPTHCPAPCPTWMIGCKTGRKWKPCSVNISFELANR